jgi:predicted nucleotidyltransferase
MTGYGCEGLCEEQRDAIVAWAKGTSEVQVVRVFGSRAKGCARADSDLDVAISASAGNYVRFADDWEKRLREVTSLPMNLHYYDAHEKVRERFRYLGFGDFFVHFSATGSQCRSTLLHSARVCGFRGSPQTQGTKDEPGISQFRRL